MKAQWDHGKGYGIVTEKQRKPYTTRTQIEVSEVHQLRIIIGVHHLNWDT